MDELTRCPWCNGFEDDHTDEELDDCAWELAMEEDGEWLDDDWYDDDDDWN